MRTVLLGNAGAGKSTLARKLIAQQPAARLSLDEVAFAGGTEGRPLAESIAGIARCSMPSPGGNASSPIRAGTS